MIKWKSISLRDLAGFISEELRKRDIETTLVGGACVTIYSENLYQSYDLDFVTRDDCPWFIEFVSPPVAVGNEPIHKFEHIKTPLGTIQMLRPTDSVKDRLASFYHWSDKQGLEQALNICSIQTVDLEEIEKWSIREGEGKKFLIFLEKFKLIQFE
jgi:hypothetical protein